MKKCALGILLLCLIYCLTNLFVVHEAVVQIEHKNPLQIISQNALQINTEQEENGYLTKLIFPSCFLYTHAQIELKSGEEQNAVIQFSAPQQRDENSEKNYIIYYNKLTVNEKFIKNAAFASFIKPYSYSLNNLTTATVAFEYKTDFSLCNMSLFYLACSLVLFVVIAAGICCFNLTVRNSILKGCQALNSKNYVLCAVTGYKNIRKEYKITFWINFLTLNIVYAYLNMNFLHGNHEWLFLNNDYIINYGAYGRYSIAIINNFMECKYLPFFTNCIGFIFLSLTPAFLLRYWKLPVTVFNILALSVPLLLHPLLAEMLYFLHLSVAYFLTPLLIIAGLSFSERKTYSMAILSVALLVFAFGDYNVCINTLAVIFLGKMLLEYAGGKSFIQLFKQYFRTIGIILISLFIYFLIIQYIKYIGMFIEVYNTKLLAFDQILPRIGTIFIDSFRHFYLTYPCIDLFYLIVLSLLFVLMFIVVLYETIVKKNVMHFIGIVFISVLLVFCSKIVYCITDMNVSLRSYNSYFSLPYVYVVAVAYILNSRLQWSRNLLFFLFIPLCFLSVSRDFEVQKYWKIGLDGDKRIMSMLAERIEEQDAFLYDNTYHFVLIGYYKSFISSYYLPKTDLTSYIVGEPYFPKWRLTDFGGYFMPRTKFKPHVALFSDRSFEDIRCFLAGVPYEKIADMKPWPHKKSVLVYGDTIVVCWQEEVLEYVKKALMEKK